MDSSLDNFLWAQKLGCSKFTCSERVQKKLSKGILGLVWDDLSKFIHPTLLVKHTKKNILLHKLQTTVKDPDIDNVQCLKILKIETDKLSVKINNLEEKCEEQEFINRQKVQQCRKKKDTSRILELKKRVIKLKWSELRSEIQDLQRALKICENLMPPGNDTVEQWMIEKSLTLVSTLASGANKKEVWRNVLEILGTVQIPVLWNILLENRISTNNKLLQLEKEDNLISNKYSKHGIQLSLAKLYSQHINIECKKHFHKTNVMKLQEEVSNYIDIIDSMYADKCPEVSEWLLLSLEVRKLEGLQTSLQKEMKELEEYLFQNSSSDAEYEELIDFCHSLNAETKMYIQDLQKSLNLLKCAKLFINTARKNIIIQLQNIASLQVEHEETDWQSTDLTTELMIFNNYIDMNAFNKIVLKGNVKAYRHLTTCINEAMYSVTVPQNLNKSSCFPMIRAPIYYLLECYKAFTVKSMLQEKEVLEHISLLEKLEQFDLTEIANKEGYFREQLIVQRHNNTMDSLNFAFSICEKTNKHVQDTYIVLDLWINQTVQEAILETLEDYKVNGATFKEWLQRYSMVLYMIQRSK